MTPAALRLWERRRAIRPECMPPVTVFVRFEDGKLIQGQESQHRTREGRRWRTLMRVSRRLHPEPDL